ncbi:MAG: molybdenum cofactor biosynthesis protein MoeA, partial [Mycobacterium sp.]|nr:molybdenum cofactor biosynthesis protein MoeA [Mycobacterium sp.]
EHGYQLRIIEQMPLDAGHEWTRDKTIDADIVLTTLRKHFDLRPDPAPRGSAPAQLWRVDGSEGTVGVIASVSESFCGACDRTRLTADGQIRSCLFSSTETDLRALLRGGADDDALEETDLRALLRGGADDDALEAAWRTAMWAKPAGHGINDPSFIQPVRPMSAIGG